MQFPNPENLENLSTNVRMALNHPNIVTVTMDDSWLWGGKGTKTYFKLAEDKGGLPSRHVELRQYYDGKKELAGLSIYARHRLYSPPEEKRASHLQAVEGQLILMNRRLGLAVMRTRQIPGKVLPEVTIKHVLRPSEGRHIQENTWSVTSLEFLENLHSTLDNDYEPLFKGELVITKPTLHSLWLG